MRRILKNNTIIITALCIMIAIVWYLNYTDGDKTKLAAGDNINFEGVNDENSYMDETLTENGLTLTDLLEVNDDALMNTDNDMNTDLDALEAENENALATNDLEDNDEFADISDEDLALLEENDMDNSEEAMNETNGDEVATLPETGDTTSTPGEAVMASITIHPSYFSSAKLTREQNRAREKEALNNMLENETVSDDLKQQAVDSLLELNDVMERENSTEILLEAKGFEGAVVSIVDGTVDVVINAPTMTEKEAAQIESIVKRKTGIDAEHIVISPVVVEE